MRPTILDSRNEIRVGKEVIEELERFMQTRGVVPRLTAAGLWSDTPLGRKVAKE